MRLNARRYVGAAAALLGVTLGTSNAFGLATRLIASARPDAGPANVRVDAVGATPLYPGLSGGDLIVTLANPNPYPVAFSTMTSDRITSDRPAACPAANITVAPATGLDIQIPAASADQVVTLRGVLSMAAAAPDGCKGATFTFSLHFTE